MNIGLYEYGFRHYDALIGRFISVDPIGEEYIFQNQYAYAINNPVSFVDYMGLGPEDWFKNKNGDIKWIDSKEKSILSEDGTVYENIGEYYLEDAGQNTLVLRHQQDVVLSGEKGSFLGLNGGMGYSENEIVFSGENAISKSSLFEWGANSPEIASFIFQSNQPLELQKEFWGYLYSKDMAEASIPIAIALGSPVALVLGTEAAIVGAAYYATGNAAIEAFSTELALTGDLVLNSAKRQIINGASKQIVKRMTFGQKRKIITNGIRKKVTTFRDKYHQLINTKNIQKVMPRYLK